MNGNMMPVSQCRKRQYPDGVTHEQIPAEKRQTTRRELPPDMPPALAQSYRQKQDLLSKMFADGRKLLSMEGNYFKHSTCKYGNICIGVITSAHGML